MIDFNEDTIYKYVLDNNKEFITMLTKDSFIYNFLLQFHSSNKYNEETVLIEEEEESKTIKRI